MGILAIPQVGGNMTKAISRREFNELLGSSAVAIGFGGRKALASENGDVGWISDDPRSG
jgi:hypothetical protein